MILKQWIVDVLDENNDCFDLFVFNMESYVMRFFVPCRICIFSKIQISYYDCPY